MHNAERGEGNGAGRPFMHVGKNLSQNLRTYMRERSKYVTIHEALYLQGCGAVIGVNNVAGLLVQVSHPGCEFRGIGESSG